MGLMPHLVIRLLIQNGAGTMEMSSMSLRTYLGQASVSTTVRSIRPSISSCFDQRERGEGEGEAVNGRSLPRYAEDGLQIAPVRRDVDVEHMVLDLEHAAEGLADGGIVGKDEYAAVVLREAQLLFGTEHAIGFYAP